MLDEWGWGRVGGCLPLIAILQTHIWREAKGSFCDGNIFFQAFIFIKAAGRKEEDCKVTGLQSPSAPSCF